ncbi:MAG: DUF21 domain-containing protein [Nitriliruptorales bacterium]|nr:DUF21 domain-containing protein [Nitriliruptorales bacterium]
MSGFGFADAWALAAAGAALLMACFLSAAQAALTRMSRVRALKLLDEERPGAERLLEVTQDPVRTLNILGLLVIILRVGVVVLLTVVLTRHSGDTVAVLVTLLVVGPLLFITSEVAPRTLALQRTDGVALATARWVRLFALPLSPLSEILVRIGDLIAPGKRLASGPFMTADELREMIDVAESDEVIESSERVMLHRVFKLGDTVVREIMVPRPDMVMVSADAPLTDVADVILAAGHSRVPVHDAEDRDQIIGLVYAKDVLRHLHATGSAEGPWGELLRETHFVPELASVDQLLRDMQTQKVHLAVVVDEYGGTAGLVTIEDVLEELVGEIVDEYDREESLVEKLADDSWRVDARLSVDRLNELLGTSLPDDEWDSVGGLLFGVLGRVPSAGERVELEHVRLTAEQVNGRRIDKVLVQRLTRAQRQALHELA